MGWECHSAPMEHRLYLSAWREHLGVSQEVFAEAAGLSHRSGISRVESGKKRLSLQKLSNLATALKINPGDLFYPPPSTLQTELTLLIKRLNEEDRAVVADTAKSLLAKEERRIEAESRRSA